MRVRTGDGVRVGWGGGGLHTWPVQTPVAAGATRAIAVLCTSVPAVNDGKHSDAREIWGK